MAVADDHRDRRSEDDHHGDVEGMGGEVRVVEGPEDSGRGDQRQQPTGEKCTRAEAEHEGAHERDGQQVERGGVSRELVDVHRGDDTAAADEREHEAELLAAGASEPDDQGAQAHSDCIVQGGSGLGGRDVEEPVAPAGDEEEYAQQRDPSSQEVSLLGIELVDQIDVQCVGQVGLVSFQTTRSSRVGDEGSRA